jgi:hypothetical protein
MLADLNIKSTKNTPEIISDIANSTISFSGNSFPENSKKFYDPINDWMKEYCSVNSEIIINCDFNYLSSSSLISVLNLFRKADSVIGSENCKLNWRYEEDDDDIQKIGLDFSKLIKMEIVLIPYMNS